MRKFESNATIVIEPWRATSFPIIKDLMVDRAAFDRIIEAGGYITSPTGVRPTNLIPVPKPVADARWTRPSASVAALAWLRARTVPPTSSLGAKIAHLNLLPQGQAERYSRVEAMVEMMDEQFGSCTNHGECEAACPKEISIDVIALMNKDYLKSKFANRKQLARA